MQLGNRYINIILIIFNQAPYSGKPIATSMANYPTTSITSTKLPTIINIKSTPNDHQCVIMYRDQSTLELGIYTHYLP
ncbi:hypothetical protein CONCODRAFT_7657 [Conidiobolus coronatus NRRL 28638]|uniref:Uncharacterized protein n=1 Tax=Conidiobolus coronatus (strain ATCC 28846 / CBS 209.66 / NRRL 28638) TaxID=796925 RepID=A0A137P4Q1_CONC2|nr:hypothetical protein CONCODRAFT_7657 [Conidiobolus coronatus NRRL 28638]|eukprot:KXN69894.1 hypothetical protein CONCODRAFT_7657 [Conidiobolus coronatus NRRL 28638]